MNYEFLICLTLIRDLKFNVLLVIKGAIFFPGNLVLWAHSWTDFTNCVLHIRSRSLLRLKV